MAIWLTLSMVILPFTQMKHHSIIWKHQFEDDIIHGYNTCTFQSTSQKDYFFGLERKLQVNIF